MKFVNNLTLRSKLTLITMVVSTVSLLVVSATLVTKAVLVEREELLESTGNYAEIIGQNCTAALQFDRSDDAIEKMSALRADKNIDAAWIYKPDGTLLAEYYRDQRFAKPDANATLAANSGFRKDSLQVFRPIMLDGNKVGSIAMRANLNRAVQDYREYALVLLLTILAASIVALVLIGRLERFVSRPILNLTEVAKAVSDQKNYALRATRYGDDELGQLVDCFNQMLVEIQKRDVQLLSHRGHLEEQVQLRTEELTKLNSEVTGARDRAEAANRAKSAFLANMSHEIRTPMTAIVGYADMMLEPDQTLSDRQDCLQVIRRNASHLLSLINDILDLSKIEADKMTVERIKVDLTQCVAEVVSLIRPRATDKGLHFDVQFDGPIPKQVLSDTVRLRQIMMNLLGNSVKFTTAGKIGLRVSCVKRADGMQRVRFDISDTGIGISKDAMGRLFQTFSQADESMTRRFGGTGLGLMISKRLAGLLGGDITVESTPGVGSVFSFDIDPGTLDQTEMLYNVSESMLGNFIEQPVTNAVVKLSGRILFAEDGLDNQRLISTHLRKAGAEVVIAPNGQIALDLMQKEHFDVVLMDMQMPVLDGYGAASKMRRLGFQQPIIALTAHAMADDRAKCINAGCSDYLTKPIDRDKLLGTVFSYMEKFKASQPPATTGAASTSAVVEQPKAASQPAGAQHRSEFSDDPDMKELVEGYVERLPVEVSKLMSLVESNEMEALRRVAHQLKGSGGGYGFPKITELAAVTDKSVKEGGDLDRIKASIDDLVAYIRRVQGYKADKEGRNATESSNH